MLRKTDFWPDLSDKTKNYYSFESINFLVKIVKTIVYFFNGKNTYDYE